MQEPPQRPVIYGSVVNQHCPQFITWFAENEEALPLNECPVALGKDRRKFSQMRNRSLGIFIAFIDIDGPLISADEPSIRQHAGFGTRRGDHFAGQFLEIVEATRTDQQFNPPEYVSLS